MTKKPTETKISETKRRVKDLSLLGSCTVLLSVRIYCGNRVRFTARSTEEAADFIDTSVIY